MFAHTRTSKEVGAEVSLGQDEARARISRYQHPPASRLSNVQRRCNIIHIAMISRSISTHPQTGVLGAVWRAMPCLRIESQNQDTTRRYRRLPLVSVAWLLDKRQKCFYTARIRSKRVSTESPSKDPDACISQTNRPSSKASPPKGSLRCQCLEV